MPYRPELVGQGLGEHDHNELTSSSHQGDFVSRNELPSSVGNYDEKVVELRDPWRASFTWVE
jgi:hypothetical protein